MPQAKHVRSDRRVESAFADYPKGKSGYLAMLADFALSSTYSTYLGRLRTATLKVRAIT